MVNIFSNDCMAGMLYSKCLNTGYIHPFVGSVLSGNDFIYLCKHLNDIDFNNKELVTLNCTNERGGDETYCIKVDEKILVKYVHCDSADKAINSYEGRAGKMDLSLPIVFVYDYRIFPKELNASYTKKSIMEFIEMETPYKKILIVPVNTYDEYENENLLIYHKTKKENKTGIPNLTNKVFEKYKEIFEG